jgi:hypothetical protein
MLEIRDIRSMSKTRESKNIFSIQKAKYILVNVLVLLCTGLIELEAQNAIIPTGSNASGTGGTASYTFGQVVYSSLYGTNGGIIQGVQQPFEITIETGIDNTEGISLEISVHPNPVTDYLILGFKDYEIKDLRYHLYDMNGNILEDKKIENNITTVLMEDYLPGIYFLKVFLMQQADKQTVIKTFKVIKN